MPIAFIGEPWTLYIIRCPVHVAKRGLTARPLLVIFSGEKFAESLTIKHYYSTVKHLHENQFINEKENIRRKKWNRNKLEQSSRA